MKINDPEKNLFVEICLRFYQTNDKFELNLALLTSIDELLYLWSSHYIDSWYYLVSAYTKK